MQQTAKPRPVFFASEQIRRVTVESARFACENFQSGSASFARNACDRFNVDIKRHLGSFQVAVLYDCSRPTDAPDIIVHQPTQFAPRLQDIQAMANWDQHDPDALLKLLDEIRRLYTQAQREQALGMGNSIVRFQLELLPDAPDLEIEVQRDRVGNGYKVSLVVPLSLTTPPDATPSRDDFCYINFDFVASTTENMSLRSSSATVQISPSLQKKVSATFKAPTQFDHSEPIIDYISQVHGLLNTALLDYFSVRLQRKAITNGLVQSFGRQFLAEMDTTDYMHLTFLSNTSKQAVLVIFRFVDFPKHPPTITLHCPFHSVGSTYRTDMTFDCPFSPRWTVETLVSKIAEQLQPKLLRFMGEKNIAFSPSDPRD